MKKSKGITESLSLLRDELSLMKKKRSELDSEIYKLELAVEKLDSVSGMLRIKRTFYEATCSQCKEKFKAKRVNAALCGKRECKASAMKEKRKGIVLLAGAKK